jgi:hypothetical protein
MQLGYIHTNRDELTKVVQVLKMTSESVALDELGIGRLRDAFADLMFPGISTLQKHIKYFSLMPQLYKRATEKRYNRLSEVKAEIIRLERIMTKVLCDNSPGANGITGSDMVNRQTNNYVKYDPAYIYNSGLQTFEILKSSQLYELIYSSSKAIHATPHKLKTDNEDINNDAVEYEGLYQFCAFPTVDYDFTQKCNIDLTPEDADFITQHILNAKACKGTLLRHLVEHPEINISKEFPGIPSQELPRNLARIQDFAKQFAKFIYIIHLRYNWIYSNYTDEEIFSRFEEKLKAYRESDADIDEILNAVTIKENSAKHFCKRIADLIASDDMKAMDDCIIHREIRVKGSRRKIGNPSYIYDKKSRIHDYELSFRWETVYLFIEELRKGGNYV